MEYWDIFNVLTLLRIFWKVGHHKLQKDGSCSLYLPPADQVASFCNGAILCQSMAASWASARLIAENPGEVMCDEVLSEIRDVWRILCWNISYVYYLVC